MKKIFFISLYLISFCKVNAQSYIGFLTDNYSGVHGVISNPANILDSRFKTDINLIGASGLVGNDFYGINIFDAMNDVNYDFDEEANTSLSSNNNAIFNVDILGPAFMFNINRNSSIAVFTRARGLFNVNEINGEIPDTIDNDDTNDFNVNEGDFRFSSNTWAEIGLTYSRVLINKEQHFLKGGITLKYLQGAGSGNASGRNVVIDYDADGTDLGGGETVGSITSSGTIVYSRFDDFDTDNYEYDLPNATGFGGDIGFVYEWRPNHQDYEKTNAKGDTYTLKNKNKYKLKLGLSITDIGSINYKEGFSDTYDINNTGVSEEDLDNAEDIDDLLNSFYTLTNSSRGYNFALPTAIHLNADWSFTNKLYLNLNTDFSLRSSTNQNTNSIANVVSLTPRFESKWLSFYLPLSVVQYAGFQAGAGLRLGPLYLGSGSVLTALTSDNSRGADAYAGLKIPVYQGKPRDKDKDGIIDKLDACPKIAGPVENNGCPWEDKDEDDILDNEDRCPEEKGVKENNGCPWGDADGDTVLDNEDECIDVKGPAENKGCPWKDTDGDGVIDKDDKCIDIKGTVDNDGCPEPEVVQEPVVTQEIQKTLNDYAKTILFNSGKSSIKLESTETLNEIVKILNEYPIAKFSIEGHTDSVGSNSLNLRLSENRASAVMTFLIENGIASNRLQSKGFGETRPVASNDMRAGRAENRRVEINLIK